MGDYKEMRSFACVSVSVSGGNNDNIWGVFEFSSNRQHESPPLFFMSGAGGQGFISVPLALESGHHRSDV